MFLALLGIRVYTLIEGIWAPTNCQNFYYKNTSLTCMFCYWNPPCTVTQLTLQFSPLLHPKLRHPRRPRGGQSGREKRRDESFKARAEKPLGTDSHRNISKKKLYMKLVLCCRITRCCNKCRNEAPKMSNNWPKVRKKPKRSRQKSVNKIKRR